MFFCVYHHDITDWNRFNDISNKVSQAPQGLKSLMYFPNKDHKSAICIWQAKSVNDLRTYLDQQCANLCRNDYFQVDDQFAQGLPKVAAPVV